MKQSARTASYVLTLLVGAALCLVLQKAIGSRVDTSWQELTKEKNSGAVTFSLGVVTSDLPVPPLTSTNGRVKFVDQDSPSSVRLGYALTAVTGAVDKSTIPHKYLVTKPIDLGAGKTITQLPLDEIHHEVEIEFVLKDQDGFKLLELHSGPHDLQSSKSNLFQGMATPVVPVSIASRTREITYVLHVEKCISCE